MCRDFHSGMLYAAALQRTPHARIPPVHAGGAALPGVHAVLDGLVEND